MKQANGIALVVTLMIALLLFIAIVTISSSLSLSGKRVTSNQKVALEAQYAAESGLSLAQVQLTKAGTEMAAFLDGPSDFKMPANTTWSTWITYLGKFCGDVNAVPLSKPQPASPGSSVVICSENDPSWPDWSDPALWANPNDAPYRIFLDNIAAGKYPPSVSAAAYWSARMGPHTVSKTLKTAGSVTTEYEVTYGFVPKYAEVLFDGSVRLVFRALPTVSVGKLMKGGNELGVRKVEQEYLGELQVALNPPSFSHFMMFTNYQRAGASPNAERVYFHDSTLFDGPVHTNEHFNFIGKPWFGDKVTSAGCTEDYADHSDCKPGKTIPRYYYWSNGHQKQDYPTGVDPAHAQPEFTEAPVWNEPYVKLPETSDEQYLAAKNGGLFIKDPDGGGFDEVGDYDIQYLVPSVGTVGGVKYQFLQVFGKELTGISYGKCKNIPNPGGGGGGGGNPTPTPVGPSIWLPQPVLRLALAGASELPAPGLLRLALNALEASTRTFRAQAPGSCPPGQYWDPNATVKTYAWFSETYRIDPNGLVERNDGSGWQYVSNDFNGVVYVGTENASGTVGQTSNFSMLAAGISVPNVTITSPGQAEKSRSNVPNAASCSYTVTKVGNQYKCIEPSIADFMQITFVGKNINIKSDLTYEDRPCTSPPTRQSNGSVTPGNCPNQSATNVMGIYSDRGSIALDWNAPKNLHVDGVLMSAKKSVYAKRWNNGSPRGDFYLTGGIIQNWYGRMGRLDSSLNPKHGYGRKFVYDKRLKDGGLAPPFFPRFDSTVPWPASASFTGPQGGTGGSGFWKPVEGQ